MLTSIGHFIVAAALGLAGFFGYRPAVLGGAGAVVYQPVPRFESSLALPLSATQTSSMTMVSGVDGNGETLMGPMCFTLDSGVANTVEDLCGTASGTVVSNLTRGTDSSGVTASSTLAHAHRVGADVKITDSPYLAQYYRLLNGIDTFPNSLAYTSHPTSTASTTIEDKNYIDSLVLAGAPAANTSTAGIGIFSTNVQLAAGAATGTFGTSTYSLFPQNADFSSVSGTNVGVVTNASGTIADGFIGQSASDSYNFSKSSLTFGASTTFAATSSVLTTNASGTVIGAQAGASGNVLQSNGTSWVSAPATIPQRYIFPNTSFLLSTTSMVVASVTLPASSATNTLYLVQYYFSGNGFQDATTTLSIGGTNIFTCKGFQTGGGGNFSISMQSSTTSEMFVGNGATNCTGAFGQAPESINMATTTTWKLSAFDNSAGGTYNAAMSVFQF